MLLSLQQPSHTRCQGSAAGAPAVLSRAQTPSGRCHAESRCTAASSNSSKGQTRLSTVAGWRARIAVCNTSTCHWRQSSWPAAAALVGGHTTQQQQLIYDCSCYHNCASITCWLRPLCCRQHTPPALMLTLLLPDSVIQCFCHPPTSPGIRCTPSTVAMLPRPHLR